MNSFNFQHGYDEQSRLILPIHNSAPFQLKHQRNFRPPVIDDDQLEYMSFILEEAFEMKRPVLVTYAGRYSPLQFYGYVSKINPYEGWLVLINGEIKKKLRYSKLMDVDWL